MTSQHKFGEGVYPAIYKRGCEMFDSQQHRKLSLMATVLGCLALAACSNQPGTVASRQSVGGAASRAATVNPAGNSADAAAALRLVSVPKGTEITAVVDQTLASDKNPRGDSFAASIARPVKVDGKTVLPRG